MCLLGSLDGNFDIFVKDLISVKGEAKFPEELIKYDSTRFYYAVVAGRRGDFIGKTYRKVRDKRQKMDIHLLHYDDLYDSSVSLETA